MTADRFQAVLGWCAIFNYAVLYLWFLWFAVAGDGLRRLVGRWFRVPREQFDGAQLLAMTVYKIAIFLFVLAPYIALRITH